MFWLWMGGLDNRSWTHVWLSIPFISFAMLVSLYYSRDLDLMVQGEETAAALGCRCGSYQACAHGYRCVD